MKFLPASLTLIFFTLFATPVFADKYQEKCPCGPDSVKGPFRLLLIAGQGHKGADFRPSCVEHDLCYDTLGESQKKCDDEFLVNLLAACEDSKRPKMARFKAKLSYWLVSSVGEGAFRSAQKIAAEKALLMQK